MKQVLTGLDTFEAYNKAVDWCRDRGYSVAPMSFPYPTGIMKGDICIAKYKNLTAKERKQLHGTITGNFREGPVTVEITKGWEPCRTTK